MHQHQPKYWFQAKGLDFEDYRHSPVYRAHCITAKFAVRILREGTFGSCSHSGHYDDASQFRMLRSHRGPAANALRSMVAKRVAAERKRIRQFGRVMREAQKEAYPDAYVRAHIEASAALARGEIRAFSVNCCPESGRVIHYETHQGWCPDPVFRDFDPGMGAACD